MASIVLRIALVGLRFLAKKGAQQAARKAAAQGVKQVGKAAAKLSKKAVAPCAKKAAAGARKVPKTYARPSSYRKGVREKTWANAKSKSGTVRDPQSGRVMNPNKKWDMGHKPGYEFRKHQQSAMDRKLTRKEFLDEHNNPKHYRPETPATNRSHELESRTGKWKGAKGK